MDNGNQNIQLRNVTFLDNRLSSGRDVLTGNSDSECIVRGTSVNIFIDSSNFTSHPARLFNVNASNISLQVYDSSFFYHKIDEKGGMISLRGIGLCRLNMSGSSFVNTTAAQGGVLDVECASIALQIDNCSFCGHRVKGKGGVISIRGTDLCKLEVADSSFLNTTAAQGGAVNIECTNIYSVGFRDNIFTGNKAIQFGGGPVYIEAKNVKNKLEYFSKNNHFLQINIAKCNFTDAVGFSEGGAVYINALTQLGPSSPKMKAVDELV